MPSDKDETVVVAAGIPMNTPGGAPRRAMTNAAWNMFATVWSIGISFVLAPLMIHYLGTEQYGILLLAWSVTGVLGIMNIGLGEATLRYVANYYSRGEISAVNRVMGSSLSLMLVMSLVVAGGFILATPYAVRLVGGSVTNKNLLVWLLRVSALIVVINVFSWTYSAVPAALHRYDVLSKITMVQNVVRSGGYILLVVGEFGILHMLLWDLVTQAATLGAYVLLVRRIAPDVKLLPSLSFKGLWEILGYSVFSFLTYAFVTMYRESGKLILGRYLGPTPIAYLGTPDNVCQRIYMVIVSGVETLLPRFSANKDPGVAQSLFLNGTWTSLALSTTLFIPLAVLMPDFLRLWINPEFARESAEVGQLLALNVIPQTAFTVAAAFFRGTGKPWIVTVVLAVAGFATIVFNVILIPAYGVLGVGYAYLIASIPFLLGFFYAWYYMFGSFSILNLRRYVGLPLLLAGITFTLGGALRGYYRVGTWFELVALGGIFAAIIGLFLVGTDLALGGDCPSRHLFSKIVQSSKFDALFKYFHFERFR